MEKCAMTNAGPWLFVDASAGLYDVRAKENGLVIARKGVRVPANGIEIITMYFPMKQPAAPLSREGLIPREPFREAGQPTRSYAARA